MLTAEAGQSYSAGDATTKWKSGYDAEEGFLPHTRVAVSRVRRHEPVRRGNCRSWLGARTGARLQFGKPREAGSDNSCGKDTRGSLACGPVEEWKAPTGHKKRL